MTFWKMTWAIVLGNFLSVVILYATIGAVIFGALGVNGLTKVFH